MKISVIYAHPDAPQWVQLDLAEGTRVVDAIHSSGLLERFPEICLENQKVGIFGQVTALDKPLAGGDRVEIYSQILADPRAVKKRRERG